jgi:hypothetical protein
MRHGTLPRPLGSRQGYGRAPWKSFRYRGSGLLELRAPSAGLAGLRPCVGGRPTVARRPRLSASVESVEKAPKQILG